MRRIERAAKKEENDLLLKHNAFEELTDSAPVFITVCLSAIRRPAVAVTRSDLPCHERKRQ